MKCTKESLAIFVFLAILSTNAIPSPDAKPIAKAEARASPGLGHGIHGHGLYGHGLHGHGLHGHGLHGHGLHGHGIHGHRLSFGHGHNSGHGHSHGFGQRYGVSHHGYGHYSPGYAYYIAYPSYRHGYSHHSHGGHYGHGHSHGRGFGYGHLGLINHGLHHGAHGFNTANVFHG